MHVKVNFPFRVKVGDEAYTEGDVVEVDDVTAAQWISNGWANRTTKPKAKAVTAAKNKARSVTVGSGSGVSTDAQTK